MADMDFNGMLENLLSDPNLGDKINQAMSALSGGEQQPPVQSSQMPDMEMIMKLKSMYDKIESADNPRINLLNALGPYLNEKRSEKLGTVIKLLKLAELGKAAGEMDLLKNLL